MNAREYLEKHFPITYGWLIDPLMVAGLDEMVEKAMEEYHQHKLSEITEEEIIEIVKHYEDLGVFGPLRESPRRLFALAIIESLKGER